MRGGRTNFIRLLSIVSNVRRETSTEEKHRKDATDENEEKNEREEGRLFTKADAEAAEMAGYTADHHGYSHADPLLQGRMVPVGVAAVDESVKLPSPSEKSHLHHSENHQKEHVHLPAISQQHHYPYEYYHPSTNYHQYGHLSYPYPAYYEHQLPHRHHSHHRHSHHHHHHHHRHHHKHHEKEIETYDTRWWYMPVDSVHRPSPKRILEYHYAPPKWYESSSRQSKMLLVRLDSKPSARKYRDCRCEVCKPSRDTPHGVRWVVNE